MREKQDYGDKITFWIKNKNKIYGVLLFVVGLVGGNSDRLASMIPASPETSVLEQRVDQLEIKLELLEDTVYNDDGGANMDDIESSRIRINK